LESAEDADNASTAGDEIAQTQDATSPVSQASSYRTGDANPGTIVNFTPFADSREKG